VHAVDKVHIGDPGRTIHDRVAIGPTEARVARPVVLADVGLDLDDAPHTDLSLWIHAHEARTQEPGGRFEGRAGERGAIEWRQVDCETKSAARSEGTSGPRSPKTAGRIWSR